MARSRCCSPIVLVLALLSAASYADNDAERDASLEAELAELKARIDELEKNQPPEPERSSPPRLNFKADFRYRYDYLDDEAAEEPRQRHRIRARGALTARVDEDVLLGFGVASGDEDPISTNQTLGNASSTKDWRLDLAYFQWNLTEQWQLVGGKYVNRIYRPEGYPLLWDGDLRPEGLNLHFEEGLFFANLGYNIIESDNRGGGQDTAEYITLSLGQDFIFDERALLRIGGGYYLFNTKGKGRLDAGRSFGNSVDEAGAYLYDYRELELFAEYHFGLAGEEAILFMDLVQNQDAPEQNLGYAVGLHYGRIEEKGDFKLGIAYQALEADAVFGGFTDSDFAGGGTDNQGQVYTAVYAIRERVVFSVTYFDTEYGEFSQGQAQDFKRLFLDLVFQY